MHVLLPPSSDKPVLVPGIYRQPLKVRGLGLEGEPAAEEVLQYCYRERPSAAEQLLAGSKPGHLVQLAALSESLDFVADSIVQLAGLVGGASAQGRRAGELQGRIRSGGTGGGAGGNETSMTETLSLMVDR